jgi:signal transduction histidine kinase
VSLLRRRSAETESPLLESISRGAHIRVNVTQPIERDGRVLGAVLLVRTPANIKQAIYGKRGPLLRATLMLLAIVLALSLLTSLTISRPVQALIRQARRAARGERGAVVPLRHPGTREIAELSETVAAMAHTLEGRAAYIRDFAANVSHEFKTPLTAIRGAVELLRDHDDTLSAGERARFLEMLDADAARLDRLVRRLLELARADVLAPGDERSAVPAVIEDVAARYRELGLGVDAIFDPACQPATAPPVVAMGVDVLDSILTALLDNVRQHAGPQAQARIDCSGDESSVSITVSDDGRGISPGNAERIFEPFFTTARERGGTGLGLAILRALLQAHDGSIERLQRERGAAFRLRIPRGRPA